MQTIVPMPAPAASRIASAANRAGTKTSDVLAPACSTASATVSKTGIPSTSSPPLPGVTPATTFVPYARLRSVWNEPFAAGDALDDETRVAVDDDRHQRLRPLSRIFVST